MLPNPASEIVWLVALPPACRCRGASCRIWSISLLGLLCAGQFALAERPHQRSRRHINSTGLGGPQAHLGGGALHELASGLAGTSLLDMTRSDVARRSFEPQGSEGGGSDAERLRYNSTELDVNAKSERQKEVEQKLESAKKAALTSVEASGVAKESADQLPSHINRFHQVLTAVEDEEAKRESERESNVKAAIEREPMHHTDSEAGGGK
mmetsp:Transcript_20635/g.58522  ORF Transcript_20635/g.58522 Transcript_20635/m.58522 type:complete len:210 (+) Transcript_20635:91-720(+)